MAALSYDSAAILKHFADRVHISYPLLSDPDSKVIQAFGILNDSVPVGNAFHGIPYPGTYLIGRDGYIADVFPESIEPADTRVKTAIARALSQNISERSG